MTPPAMKKKQKFKCCPDGPWPLHALDCPGRKHRHRYSYQSGERVLIGNNYEWQNYACCKCGAKKKP